MVYVKHKSATVSAGLLPPNPIIHTVAVLGLSRGVGCAIMCSADAIEHQRTDSQTDGRT